MGQSIDGPTKPARSSRCPICSAPAADAFRPFCSSLCADVDLLRWLRGSYAIAGGSADDDEDGDDTQAAQQSVDGSSKGDERDAPQGGHDDDARD